MDFIIYIIIIIPASADWSSLKLPAVAEGGGL